MKNETDIIETTDFTDGCGRVCPMCGGVTLMPHCYCLDCLTATHFKVDSSWIEKLIERDDES